MRPSSTDPTLLTLDVPLRLSRGTRRLASEALFLADGIRAGALDARALHLADYCGDPAACFVSGAGRRKRLPEAWLSGLSAWGRPALVCAAVAAASRSCPASRS